MNIEFGPDGNLYYADFDGGTIRRVAPTTPPPGTNAYLSDLTWTSMTNGWGPVEKDRSNNDPPRATGRRSRSTAPPIAKGLGAHAASDVRYVLGGTCTRFKASVGIDDEVGSIGSVVFEVYADRTKVYDSGSMTGASATKTIDVSIAGASELRLVVTDGGDNFYNDHADWALARIECGGGSDTTPPTITARTPAPGATGVAASVSPTATFSEAMDPATLNTSTFTLVQQGQPTTPLPATVSYAAQVATLDPTSNLLANTTYTATVKGGASGAKDLAGIPLAADSSWSFTTAAGADTTPPTITARTPAPGATGVAVSVSPTATFSEAMDPATLNTSTFTLVQQGQPTTPIPATVSYAAQVATLDPTSNLLANTTYTATVKGGASGAKDLAGIPLAADSSWSFTTGSGQTTSTYLSDLTWTSMTNGFGPLEKDMSNGWNGTGDGVTLSLNGTTYAKGLGGHAASDVRYALGSGCTRFKADVGVDDEVGTNGSVVFEVYADASNVYTSPAMTGDTATATVDVSIAGASELRLMISNGGDGFDYDHADWALARIECGGGGGGNQPPVPVIDTPASTFTWKVGDPVSFTGHATDPEQGTLPAAALSWELLLQHCPSNCHTHPLRPGPGPRETPSTPPTTSIRPTSSSSSPPPTRVVRACRRPAASIRRRSSSASPPRLAASSSQSTRLRRRRPLTAP